jgi:segregation and condensation protein A
VTATGEGVRESFLVRAEAFSGSLAELARALRAGRLAPSDIDVLALVRQFLGYFGRVSAHDLELASEALPQLARVIELKVRLLLPRPKLEAEEEADLAETLESIDMLAELEEAIRFLRLRREERRLVLPVGLPRPPYAREEPAIRLPLSRLAELAGRYRAASYFELAVERVTLAAAMRGIVEGLTSLKQRFLGELSPSGWLSAGVHFAAMLELVKEGRVRAVQEEPFGPIALELLEARRDQEAA